jgi:hypothetical protein
LDQGNALAAREYLERVESLGIQPPAVYHFYWGQVLMARSQWQEAKKQLENYVAQAGKEGEHYVQSLEMLTEIEQSINKLGLATAKPTAEVLPGLENQRAAAYDKKVKNLYLDENVAQSLVTHLNSLLQTHAYIEGKVKNLERGDRIEYTLSLGKDSTLIISERNVRQTAAGPRSALNVSYLGVFGVNPLVKFRCSKETDSCIFRHPVEGNDWIRMANDEAGAQEIAMALTRLLQILQRG